MSPSLWQLALVVVLIALLFGGRGKISAVMGDLAKGITSFRKGLKDNDEAAPKAVPDTGQTIDAAAEQTKDKAQS